MWRNKSYLQTTSLLFGVFALSACQPETQSVASMNLSTPARIAQAREVDRNQLRPVVRLSDGSSIVMQQTGEDTWSGTINVQPNASYAISLEWLEALSAGDLLLATWSDNIVVGADAREVNLSIDDYDYSPDTDGDSFSNLEERENNTDPFVFTEVMTNIEDADGNIDETDDEDANETDDEENGETSDDDAGITAGESDVSATSDAGGTTTETGATDETGATAGTTTDGTDGTDGSDGSDGVTDAGTATAGQIGETDDGETDGDTDSTADNNDDDQTRAPVLVPRILPSQAPDIDGLDVLLSSRNSLIGEWANAVQTDQSGAGLWIDRLMLSNPGNEDNAEDGDKLHRWAAMHDGTYLYVVVLSDDIGLRTSDSTRVFQDDALEVFIDGNNSQLTEWGDDDDFHFLIALRQLNSNSANNDFIDRVDLGPGPTSTLFDFEFWTGPDQGPDGVRIPRFEQDVYEIRIPIEDAGITIGETFGFELQLDDDDNGGDRDSKWGWAHPSRQDLDRLDLTFINPSVMGRLVLEE